MVARVLVVEDEDAIRDPLSAALRAAGHEVKDCAGGVGFEDVVDTFRPDLALLDVHLPGGRDGF
jgi:two-component system OmpR family response regulator